MHIFFKYVVAIVAGFCLGGIMFSRLLPRVFLKVDVTQISDDHNPGTVNVIKYVNKPLGFACMALDIGKGWLPVELALDWLPWHELAFGLVMLAPVLGHAIAPFDSVHGGKAIATAFGVYIAMLKISYSGWVLAALLILFSTLVKLEPHSRRVIIAYSCFAGISVLGAVLYTGRYSIMVGTLLIAAVVILRNSVFANESNKATAAAEPEYDKV